MLLLLEIAWVRGASAIVLVLVYERCVVGLGVVRPWAPKSGCPSVAKCVCVRAEGATVWLGIVAHGCVLWRSQDVARLCVGVCFS